MTLYDPLTFENLMVGVTAHFEKQVKVRLDQATGIQGPGIYALYYCGSHPAYQPIAAGDTPIYVGKALPPGARKGTDVDETKPVLQSRIDEHRDSITQATNLQVPDFWCRYLAVKAVWITLAERFLIDRFKPVWNPCLDGFGNHDPGKGRYNGQRSW